MHLLSISVLLILLLLAFLSFSDSLSLQSFVATKHEGHAHRPDLDGLRLDLRSEAFENSKSWLSRFRRDVQAKPVVDSVFIESRIASRFAETQVMSVISNPTDQSNNAEFSLQIPEKAFISNFTMLIDGQLIVTEVKSKEEAQTMFEEAMERNQTAGLVSSDNNYNNYVPKVNGMDRFSVAITIKANSNIEFTLTYVQLLERYNGMYEQVISMRPNQIVDNFVAEIYIYDPQEVRDLTILEPSLGTNTVEYQIAQHESISPYLQRVSFAPTVEQQRAMDSELGINGNFAVSYDVNHQDDVGLVQIEDNTYFVHYFSPDEQDYTPLSKNIIFVIDISGSMSGGKIDQTREAIQVIFGQLHTSDTFMIILFDDLMEYWPSNKQPVKATTTNINAAKAYAKQNIYVDGGTNINDAVTMACRILRNEGNSPSSNIIVFLTDGEPTAGETNVQRIVANVADEAAGQVSIFSLAFGYNLDFILLEMLAYRTGGDVQRIYEGEDAAIQLKNFYKSISSPLIYDVEMIYPKNVIDIESITKSSFNQFFKGSELVVVGKMMNEAMPETWECTVSGVTDREIKLKKTVNSVTAAEIPVEALAVYRPGFIEKLYVYLKIKDLLRQVLTTDNDVMKEKLEQRALQLALSYQLVTPLTSMIIVQQERQDSIRDSVAVGKSMTSTASLIMGSSFIWFGLVALPLLLEI